jgi:hypothetical protein
MLRDSSKRDIKRENSASRGLGLGDETIVILIDFNNQNRGTIFGYGEGLVGREGVGFLNVRI